MVSGFCEPMIFMAKKFTDMGEEQIYEFIRFMTMSAGDFLDEYFENDLVKTLYSTSYTFFFVIRN